MMVSVIGSAVLFVAIVALCSTAFSRYANFRKRQRASTVADKDVDNISTGPPDAANPIEDFTAATAVSTMNQLSSSGVTTPQTASIPSVKKTRTHRRTPHLISYAGDESGVGAPNGFSWKQFFLPARHIAFRHRDSESAAGEGYKLDSLSISPSRPVVFSGGGEKVDVNRASMCVVLTPPSPELRPRSSEDDELVVEEVRNVIETEIEAVQRNQPLIEETSATTWITAKLFGEDNGQS